MDASQSSSAVGASSNHVAPLESVVCTEELGRRPWRSPEHIKENRALTELVQALADSPGTILQRLAETILDVLQADSAGVSLLTTLHGGKRFYWPAIAGAWKPYIGRGTPRELGPCGDVLAADAPMLFRHFERRYASLEATTPTAEEALVIPFHSHGTAVGTIWAIAHDERRGFDAEDLRQLESLGRFASATYHFTELRDADDSRRAALNLMEDAVHARRATERLNVDLRKSEARYRTLFDLGPVAVYSCDREGVITEFNGRAAELWGRTPAAGNTDERFCGSFRMFRPDGTFMSHAQCPMADVLSGAIPQVEDREVHIERPDGSRVVVVAAIRPLTDARGEIAGAVNCFYDITERKQAEVALRESEDRSREMAEALRQSVSDMAEVDRRKNEFLATLAHELRNPLAPIRNALNVMRLSSDNANEVHLANEMLERQVGQLVRLVDDLLDVSRISRGKVELRRETVDLSPIVKLAIEAVRPAFAVKGVELEISLPPHRILLNADATRLAQVFGNLLNNACKFTDRGGRVGVSIRRDGGEVAIRVRDTGVGIAAEQLPRVFDMFAQVETSIERSAGGLGIGLTLAKEMVERHGGTVQAGSAGVNQGSEFVVRLPIANGNGEPEAAQRRRNGGMPMTASPRRILVVDDNWDSARTMSMLMEFAGNETRMVHDGVAAVEAAAEYRPDVVLLDIGLPKLNGYDAARRIREQPWGKEMVLVALTGWGQENDKQKSSEAGFDAHVVKPVDFETLLGVLASHPAKGG